jgi:hypothetical protein
MLPPSPDTASRQPNRGPHGGMRILAQGCDGYLCSAADCSVAELKGSPHRERGPCGRTTVLTLCGGQSDTPDVAAGTRDGQILAIWPTEMPIYTSLRRNVPHFAAPSRQRKANKRSKGLTAVPAIRPLTCTSW